MTLSTRLFAAALLLTVGCARQNFTTQWSMSPDLAPADVSDSEFQRRERERRQEVSLLKTEALEVGRFLNKEFHLLVLKPGGFFSAELRWSNYTPAQRIEIAVLLDRFKVLARRINLLTGRRDDDDPTLRRARNLRNDLAVWVPKPDPYYAH